MLETRSMTKVKTAMGGRGEEFEVASARGGPDYERGQPDQPLVGGGLSDGCRHEAVGAEAVSREGACLRSDLPTPPPEASRRAVPAPLRSNLPPQPHRKG